MKLILFLTSIFPVVLAFGIQTNGLRRKEIIKFGKVGTILSMLLFLALSIFNKEFWILTATVDYLLVFVISNLVFSLVFRNVRNP